MPRDYTEQEVHDLLQGAAGTLGSIAETLGRAHGSVPCDEYRADVEQAKGLLEGVARGIEDVQASRAG